MQRPWIAVNVDVEEQPRAHLRLSLEYLDFIAEAGGVPVPLPPLVEAGVLLERCHGLLLTGGDDYGRCWQGRSVPADFAPMASRREEADFGLARASLLLRTPTLGICAGFQLQVLAEDGELFGDLPSEMGAKVRHRRARPEDPAPEHPIDWQRAEPAPPIATGRYSVNSYHHQGVRRLPAGWRSLACSEDGLIEAACSEDGTRIGVQWHPERDRSSPINRALIQALVDRARRRALSAEA